MQRDLEHKLQLRFLDICRAKLGGLALSNNLTQAFLAVPRVNFVSRYRLRGETQWHTVTDSNRLEHVPAIYQDQPLTLVGSDDASVTSTISMPSFVLHMLHLLDLEPGHSVFEIGTGSGYAAAVMAKAVEPGGWVTTSEILTPIAEAAGQALDRARIHNVTIVSEDGGAGYAAAAPYDRIIYTAGAYDLPRAHMEQLRDGGRMVFVLKNRVGGNATLLALEKRGDCLYGRSALPCGFVGFAGKHAVPELEPVRLRDLPEFRRIRHALGPRRPFHWSGAAGQPDEDVLASLQGFLDLAYPNYQPLTAADATDTYGQSSFFGFWSTDRLGLAVARNGTVVTYGDRRAEAELFAAVHAWLDIGMPGLHHLDVTIRASGQPKPAGLDSMWRADRPQSTFYWSRRR